MFTMPLVENREEYAAFIEGRNPIKHAIDKYYLGKIEKDENLKYVIETTNGGTLIHSVPGRTRFPTKEALMENEWAAVTYYLHPSIVFLSEECISCDTFDEAVKFLVSYVKYAPNPFSTEWNYTLSYGSRMTDTRNTNPATCLQLFCLLHNL